MSNKIKVVLNRDEVSRQLLKSPEMQAILSELASPVAQRAGDGYEAAVKSGKRRCYANIATTTVKAAADNAENNTLLRSLK